MVDPGESINYTVNVTSNDSVGCTAINYTVTPSSAASGFTFSPASQVWNLAPGANNSRIFTATSPATAADGLYTMNFKVTNSDNANSVTRDVSFIVANTKAIPPTIDITGITNGGTINPSTNTKITATAAHSTGISIVEIYIDNKLVAKCTEPKNGICDVFVKGSNTVAGTHTMRVVAIAKDAEQTNSTANLTFGR
jgi:hypothetical protein